MMCDGLMKKYPRRCGSVMRNPGKESIKAAIVGNPVSFPA
jgi:hypothetical protein